MSARIRVADFVPSKSQKRVKKRNSHLERRATSPWATEAQYDLFRNYLDSRHASGGMADMDMFEFAAMVEETPIRSRLIEFTDRQSEELRAVCLTDILDDGLSLGYSFFDTDFDKDSLGTFIILEHIAIAIDLGLPYVYLGYWVPGSPKMDYKSKFSGLEVFHDRAWGALQDTACYDNALHPLSTDPIAEQVARISLPDSRPTG
jgi:arginine-tRNA-protein transferase